jgi:murein DD-endopeptidase MepM/ murein hydrolase activator NlpD
LRRLVVVLGLAAAFAGAARAETHTYSLDAPALAGSEAPNTRGSVVFPVELSLPPPFPETRSYEQLLDLWQRAGEAYGVPWEVLAAINKIETNFGQSMGPSSAGAVGWMQFLPSTWESWGTDASGDGIADPWNPEDAVHSAARYLAAAGASEDLYRGVFAYNHADWYVADVLELASVFSGGGGFAASYPFAGLGTQLVFAVDDIDQRIEQAESAVSRARARVAETELEIQQLGWRALTVQQRAGNPELSGSDFRALEARTEVLARRAVRLERKLERRRQALDRALGRLEALHEEDSAVTFTRPSWNAAAGVSLAGNHVFPVYGPSSFSDDFGAPRALTGWHHGNDIFAPFGAPIVAVADGVLFQVGETEIGGNRLWLRDGAGNGYYYAHLASFSPLAQEGAAVRAGDVLGYVGTSGDAVGTPPHLHFEIHPSELAGLGYDAVVNPYQHLLSWTRLGAEGTSGGGEPAARTLTSTTSRGPRVFTIVDDEPVVSFTR